MKHTLVVLLAVLVLLLVACGGQAAPAGEGTDSEPGGAPGAESETAAGDTGDGAQQDIIAPAEQAPAPETISLTIGPEGGSLVSADGGLEVKLDPGALAESVTLTIVSRQPSLEEGKLDSLVYDVTIDPKVDLAHPARLTYLMDAPELAAFGLWIDLRDSPVTLLGDAPDSLALWVPVGGFNRDANGHLVVFRPVLSTYAVVSDAWLSNFDLAGTFPPPPEGYAYIGSLAADQVLKEWPGIQYPLDRAFIAGDQAIYEKQAGWDVIHFYTQKVNSTPEISCPEKQAPDWWRETSPIGMGMVPENQAAEADLVFTQATTIQFNGSVLCNKGVQVGYVISQTIGSDTAEANGCVPDASFLTPMPAPSGSYPYIGTEVIINGMYAPGYSTLPQGTLLPAQVLRQGTTSGGSDCSYKVWHYYGDTSKDTFTPSYSSLGEQIKIEGYVYQGRRVTSSDVVLTEYTNYTMPVGMNQDWLSFTTGFTVTEAGQTLGGWEVSHYYLPDTQAACVPPNETWNFQAKDCYQHTGSFPVVGLQSPGFPGYTNFETLVVDAVPVSQTVSNVCDPLWMLYTYQAATCQPASFSLDMFDVPYVYEQPSFLWTYIQPGSLADPFAQDQLLDYSVSRPFTDTKGSFGFGLLPGTQVTLTFPDGTTEAYVQDQYYGDRVAPGEMVKVTYTKPASP